MMHPGFKRVVESHWRSNDFLSENITNISTALTDWNKEHFGIIFKRKRLLWARLAGI